MDERADFGELQKKRAAALTASQKAVRQHPEAYRELKELVESILSEKLDVSEYYPMANRLSRLLQKLIESGPGTIFYYFYQNIDPNQGGEVRYFRAVCFDLHTQLNHMDQFRMAEQQIRRIK